MRFACWSSLLLCLCPCLASCGGGGSGGGSTPFGLEQRVLVQGLGFPTGLPSPAPLQAVRAFPALTFTAPVFLTFAADGTNRVFVVEQAGRIRVFDNDDATSSAGTFLDITAKVNSGGEEGLLGLAFDPAYAVNGFFYVYYSAANPRRSVIARYRVTANADVADPASEVVLLEIAQPYSNHNGGMMAFGPDGMLYVGLGDGGSGGDPGNRAQDKSTLLGKILRIDPGLPAPYIPPDNPFVGEAGSRGEIWALGVRNPWRFSFDRGTGDLWVGDVGQSAWEEVDLVRKGDNLGWRVYEGTEPYNNPLGLPLSAFRAPVITYSHSEGCSVTGGYVYRGNLLAGFVGAYFYGDYCSGNIWALVWDGSRLVSSTQVASVSSLVSFGEDRDGELYAVSQAGSIWRFQGTAPGPEGFPQQLSATGLFLDTATLEPAAGLIEYEVNAPLWTDGARKRRWIALPGNSRIGFHATEAWDFPSGTVLVKHFEIETSPGVTRRIETRVLILGTTGWAGYTYRWNTAGTDADLLPGAASDTFEVTDGSGTRTQTWNYPSRAACLSCHTEAAGRVLGVRTRQLHRDFDYPAATDDQLRSWNHIGLFRIDIGDAGAYEAYPDPADPAASLDAKARAYLAVNCAVCHLPGGPAPLDLDLRWGTPTPSMHAVGVVPVGGDLGLANAQRIRATVKESSVLWERMRRLDGNRMPPLGSGVVDAAGLSLIGEWIDSGPP